MAQPISVQLYSLREELQKDLTGVIAKLAETGYVGVEPYGGLPPAETAKAIQANGLKVESSHLGLPLGDDQSKLLDAAATYGIDYLIVPSQPRDDFKTVDGIKRVCERLNQANEAVRKNGMTLGYHNHEFEFVDVEGRPGYKVMLEELEPSIIFQPDTYWIQVAGLDAAKVVAELGDRAPLLHIKDGPASLENRNAPMTAVGKGSVDVEGIIKAGSAAKWLIVELDSCATDMMTAVIESYNYLTENGLASGSK